MKLLNLVLSDEAHKGLKILCAKEGITIREWFQRTVWKAIEEDERLRREGG